jgi:hypothetical protein
LSWNVSPRLAWVGTVSAVALSAPYACAAALMRITHHGSLSPGQVALGIALVGTGGGAAALLAWSCRPTGVGWLALTGAVSGVTIGGTWFLLLGVVAGVLKPTSYLLPYLWAALPGAVVGALVAVSLRSPLELARSSASLTSGYRALLLKHGAIHLLLSLGITAKWGPQSSLVPSAVAATILVVLISATFKGIRGRHSAEPDAWGSRQ